MRGIAISVLIAAGIAVTAVGLVAIVFILREDIIPTGGALAWAALAAAAASVGIGLALIALATLLDDHDNQRRDSLCSI